MRRVGIFGWGVVAPKSPNIEAFERNLGSTESWLSTFDGFGPNNFLVGTPEFRFSDYKPWIDARFPPNRYPTLERKMGQPTQFAIGAYIQALAQNQGIEAELQKLGLKTHVYVGSGVGDVPTSYDLSLQLHRAQRKWDRFWSAPDRNAEHRAFLALSPEERAAHAEVPPAPETVPEDDRDLAEEAYWHHWAGRSVELRQYLAELKEIESLSVEGDVESAKLAVIKEKKVRTAKLQKKWGAPPPPWACVPADILWNIHNTPASQVSMMGQLHGATFAPVAACSTFGYVLKLAMNAIQHGEATAVVMGASDPAPHPLIVGGFYDARVISADREVSKPLTELRGTHVAGGSVMWILGDYDHFTKLGMKPLGMEPVSVGWSADAFHLITPTKDGPTAAMKQALARADARPEDVVHWDMHATATPGDALEVETLRGLFSENTVVAARKGTFGHGMSAAGGWELTAMYLGYQRGRLFPTTLKRDCLNAEIAKSHTNFVFDEEVPAPDGLAGKASMGIGGINAMVLSRPWK